MLSTAICARILGVHSGSGAARVLEACRGAWLARLEEVAEGRHVFKNMNEKKIVLSFGACTCPTQLAFPRLQSPS